MLVFSTRLPLDDNVTKEDCIKIFIEWITASPHYGMKELDYQIMSNNDYDYSKDNFSLSVRHLKNDNIELAACRFENKESDAVWHNDSIFLCENNSKSLLIQLNCNRINYNTQLPRIHKPYIVRKFVEAEYCKDDADIPVCDTPIEINESNIEMCAKIMTGNYTNKMPVVYVSCTYDEKYVVDVNYLANQLSGVAHVFKEKNREIAKKLREKTDSNNVYIGYVGIYFPGTKICNKHGIEYYVDDREMVRSIINSVWSALINRIDSSSYSWNHIIASQSRQKMSEWQNISTQDKQQLDEYMNIFDAENKDLHNQIDELSKEKYSLQAQLDVLKATLKESNGEQFFYKMGGEPNLYPSERNDLLYSILSQAKDKFEEGSRGYILIRSLLEANPKNGECSSIISEVKTIFSGDGKLTSTRKSQLKRLGFNIEEDSSHYKMTFRDSRYGFTVAKTPGDYREGKNMFSDISKMIDVEKKL